MRAEPVFRDYIWGGTRLKTEYGKVTDLSPVAESWELSDCPVLIKLIDARDVLSVQVHPDDEYARLHETMTGKTEMWVILDCEADSFVYYGFNREIERAEVRRRIENGTLTEVLYNLPVKRGDVIFIPAGTIHAIGKGILLAEVQQHSDLTYRVYDYNRLGADGKPRPLHIEKALDVLDTGPASHTAPGARMLDDKPGCRLECLAETQYFITDRLTLSGLYGQSAGAGLSVLCVEGSCSLECDGEALNVTKGECVYISAGLDDILFAGDGVFLLVAIPQTHEAGYIAGGTPALPEV